MWEYVIITLHDGPKLQLHPVRSPFLPCRGYPAISAGWSLSGHVMTQWLLGVTWWPPKSNVKLVLMTDCTCWFFIKLLRTPSLKKQRLPCAMKEQKLIMLGPHFLLRPFAASCAFYLLCQEQPRMPVAHGWFKFVMAPSNRGIFIIRRCFFPHNMLFSNCQTLLKPHRAPQSLWKKRQLSSESKILAPPKICSSFRLRMLRCPAQKLVLHLGGEVFHFPATGLSGSILLAIILCNHGPCTSGKVTVCYWKLPFIVDLHFKNGDVP